MAYGVLLLPRRLDLSEFVTQIQAFRRTNSVTIKDRLWSAANIFEAIFWWQDVDPSKS